MGHHYLYSYANINAAYVYTPVFKVVYLSKKYYQPFIVEHQFLYDDDECHPLNILLHNI